MTFTIPNQAAAPFLTQAAPDATDIAALAAAPALTGVISGCGVTANGSTLVLAVAAGAVRVTGQRVTVAGGTVTITTADAVNPRRDIVSVNASGTLVITAGTPAAVTSSTGPVKPAVPASSVLLAEVYVPATGTAALSAWLTDKSLVVNDPRMELVNWYGAKGDTRIVTDASCTASSTTMTSATAAFTAADTGKSVTVVGAAAAGAQLITTVTFVNATTVTLGAAATVTVAGAWCSIGTNDAAALQAWINAAYASGNPGVLVDTGAAGSGLTYYKTNTQLSVPGSNVTLTAGTAGGGSAGNPGIWIDGTGINSDGNAILVMAGTNGTAYTMSANVVEGAMAVVTTTAPGATLIPGAWIRIEDTQASAASGMLNGEICQVDTVASVAGTTTVYLRTGINSPSYLTASTAKFTVLSFLNNIIISGIGFQGAFVGPRNIDAIQAGSTVIASAVGTSLIVANGAQFATGQFIIAGLPNEIMQITGIASNTLTVTRGTGGVPANATLAAGMDVLAMPVTPMRQSGLQLTTIYRVTITGCAFDHCGTNGIGLTDCLFSSIENNYFTDVMDYGYPVEAGDTTNGYGISVTGASQWSVITGNQGIRCKFLVCMTGSQSQGGCPRAHVVSGNVAIDSFYGGFDCHPGADDIDFLDNVVNYTREAGNGQYDGIFVDGGRVTVRGNKIRGAGRHGILVNNNNTLRLLRANIENNQVTYCGYYDTATVRGRGIQVSMSLAQQVETACVRNNDVRYCASSEIQILGTATISLYHGIQVTGNTIHHGAPAGAGTALAALYVQFAGNGVIADNIIRQDNTGADGLFLANASDFTVTGNCIECTVTAASAAAIHFTTVTHTTVTGNRTKNHFNSLLMDTTSDTCAIGHNDFSSSVGTAVTLTGTGNKIAGNIGYNPVGHAVAQPAIAASTVAVTNTAGVDCTVFVNGGTVSAVAVGGTATGVAATGRDFRVPAGQTITLTYSVAPTWQWFGD